MAVQSALAQPFVNTEQFIMKKIDVDQRTIRIAATVAAASVLGGAVLYAVKRRRRLATPTTGPYPVEKLPTDAYDAVIVGGGPSGSTCAFYLAKAGAKVLRSAQICV